jgi:CheY-like chemotaxis protein
MGLKVLLVDDEEDILEVIQDRLEAYGFTVVTAGTGLEALRKLFSEQFDGVFLDIRMPEMDGMEALEKIRERDNKIPVIILTSSSTQQIAFKAIAKGANEFILKPFEWEELKAKIQRVFRVTMEG